MGMSQQLQVLDLSFHPTRHVPRDELLSGNNLQGNLLVRDPVSRQLDLPKTALPKRADDMVGPDALLGLPLRRGLNGPVFVAIRLAASACIGRFVLSSAVRGWCKGYL